MPEDEVRSWLSSLNPYNSSKDIFWSLVPKNRKPIAAQFRKHHRQNISDGWASGSSWRLLRTFSTAWGITSWSRTVTEDTARARSWFFQELVRLRLHIWLVVWNMIFFHMLGMSSSQLAKSIIFQRGRAQPPRQEDVIQQRQDSAQDGQDGCGWRIPNFDHFYGDWHHQNRGGLYHDHSELFMKLTLKCSTELHSNVVYLELTCHFWLIPSASRWDLVPRSWEPGRPPKSAKVLVAEISKTEEFQKNQRKLYLWMVC